MSSRPIPLYHVSSAPLPPFCRPATTRTQRTHRRTSCSPYSDFDVAFVLDGVSKINLTSSGRGAETGKSMDLKDIQPVGLRDTGVYTGVNICSGQAGAHAWVGREEQTMNTRQTHDLERERHASLMRRPPNMSHHSSVAPLLEP
jgi:hypothetical protein